MAVKKSFKTDWNPAMQFISVPEAVAVAEEGVQKEEPMADSKVQKVPTETQIVEKKPPVPLKPLEAQSAVVLMKGPKAPPEGYKVNPMYVETKSRRLQLLMQPSLYEKVKGKAGEAGQSVNEWIHACLEAACQDG